jgi:anti-sigma regulatory factor (Ser/Thr protein kinase)
MKTALTELRPGAHAAAQAREFVLSQLSAWQIGQCRDEAALAASELVTNAVRHGRGPITVRMAEDNRCVRLEVGDASRLEPAARAPDGPEGGFGLHLVDAVCTKWGVSQRGNGKVVWCECEQQH